MSRDVIRPERLATGESSTGEARLIGTITIQAPHALVCATDAPGSTTMLLQHADPADSRIGMMLYTVPQGDAPHGHGLVAQFTPAEARGIAASLLRLALILDPVKPN